jgi:hypothetical protein
MMIRTLLAAALVVVTATPTLANDVNAQVPIDDSFAVFSTGWSGGMPGQLVVAWRPLMVEGRGMICGAYAVTNSQLRPVVNDMLRQGFVEAAGRPVLRNMRFFNRTNARDEAGMVGQTANCTVLPDGPLDQQSSISLGSGGFRN